MKVCSKCHQEKSLSQYHNRSSSKDGKSSACKDCRNSHNREWAQNIGYDVLYRRAVEKDPKKYKDNAAKKYRENLDSIKQRSRDWSEKNKDRKRSTNKRHYESNKEAYIERAKNWGIKNKEKRSKVARDHSARFYSDPANKPVILSRKLLSRTLLLTGKRKTTRTETEIGYTSAQLKKHLEFHFQDGMSWDNHGEWHVDHIIPVTEMVALGVTCPKKINALSNLRPVWASDNLSKNNRFDLSSPMVNV